MRIVLGLGISAVMVIGFLYAFYALSVYSRSAEAASARTEAFRARCLTVGFTVEQCQFFKDGAGK